MRRWLLVAMLVSPLVWSGCSAGEEEMDKVATGGIHRESVTDARSVNRLADESSPYLLQHAHNPVNWYPWGEEAIDRSRKENKPIFLSIGYSACHWCHVMERESFESEEIAAILNEHFVSIKVDREERPDIDEIYMTAVQMMTGSGGWPLTVFLTPDLKPFYGGTYFPPEDRYGRPGFKSLLISVADAWSERGAELAESAEKLTEAIAHISERKSAESGRTMLQQDVVRGAVAGLIYSSDPLWGGFGSQPKFPQTGALILLLRQYARTGNEELLNTATLAMDRMASGGIYDHIGGGFHRYSVDRQWLVPHFEKMLYDNALLSELYLEGYQATGITSYRRVAVEVLDYVLRDMLDEAGGFHSAEDADSEGEEGKYYVWSSNELEMLLGKKDAELFGDYYGVTPSGNYEGHNILNTAESVKEFARRSGAGESEMIERLAELRAAVLKARQKRVRPGKDDKVLASWNGLMISSLARGYQVLGENRFRDAALRAGEFIHASMMHEGRLMHTFKDGVSKQDGYLDDYANVANSMIDLYETTLDIKWLERARYLADEMLRLFADDSGGYYFTSKRHKDLIVRTKPFYDGSVPSGNAMAARVFLRLGRVLDREDMIEASESILLAAAGGAGMTALSSAYMLRVLENYAGVSTELVLVGKIDSSDMKRMLSTVHRAYLPDRIIVFADASINEELNPAIPLLFGKTMLDGKATLYICENNTCKKPMTDVPEIDKILRFSID